MRSTSATGTFSNNPLPQKTADIVVQEFRVRRIAGGSGRVSPQRWDRHQRNSRDERRFIARVADGEVEIRFRRHVQQRNLDGAQGSLDVPAETGSGSDV